MDTNEIKEQVKAAVSLIFAEKEEADRQHKTEEALNKAAATIEDLTKAVEAKSVEITALETKVEEASAMLLKSDEATTSMSSEISALKETITQKDTEIASAKADVDRISKEKETIASELATTKLTIEDIAKSQAAIERYSMLEEAKVATKDKDGQIAKVKDMSDDEFESYKSELISFREAIVASLGKTKPTNTTSASLNMENDAVISTKDKYDALGKALASLIIDTKETK